MGTKTSKSKKNKKERTLIILEAEERAKAIAVAQHLANAFYWHTSWPGDRYWRTAYARLTDLGSHGTCEPVISRRISFMGKRVRVPVFNLRPVKVSRRNVRKS